MGREEAVMTVLAPFVEMSALPLTTPVGMIVGCGGAAARATAEPAMDVRAAAHHEW